MAEYYTQAESDARYARTDHTHALDALGGELSADRVSIPETASALFEDAYSLDEALFSVADQLAGKAAADHTHENLTVTPAAHTHAQSEVTGLEARLTEIEADIANLQSGAGSDVVAPMLVASMHLGKLDNNSGAEVTSASRICSDPFAVENGKSYWQVNDKGVNMYVLIYDADEMFLQYLGNFASGAEIEVNNANAAYMRISSLVGEYDLTNEFRIYDEDPNASTGTEEEGFTQADADLLYAPISHTHDYAAADHTHDGFAATAHTHTAADITGLPSSVDAYSKTEADTRFAAAAHTHTASDITGLPASVDAYSKAEVDSMMAGKASLVDGVVPDQQLPSYMDDVIEGTLSNAITFRDSMGVKMPAASDKIYVDTTTNKCYRWSGSTYVEIGGGGVALGETSATAHRGDHGKIAYDHSQDDDVHVTAAQKNAWNSKADSDHTHTASEVGAAAFNHSHSGYASSGHSHTPSEVGAVPATGGTFIGEVTIGYGLNTGTIVPFDSGSYAIGSSDNRYYSTYLRVNPNVSSDRRCKRDIEAMDIDALAAFVNKLSVVNYNYNDDAADEAKRIGLIAQDVVAADPTIAQGCIEQDEKGFYSLRAADLVFPLIAAVQALTKRVEELEGN